MANDKFLTVDKVSKISELVNVKRVSDLKEPTGVLDGTDSTFLQNTYLLTSTYINNYNKYVNYKLKLNEITNYLQEAGNSDLIEFKRQFELFISNLIANTQDSFVRFEPTSDNGNPNSEYSYIITPQYSELNNNVNPFNDSSYAYTDVLTNGIITSNVLEEYVRNTLGRVLGVPSTPAYVSEAIDSVIEFIDWFKGYVRDDTSYGSLQNLIDTIESRDSITKQLSYDYTDSVAENIKNLAYEYTDVKLEEFDGGGANYTAGNNISIDNDTINCYIGVDSSNNTLTISGTRYSLTFDANGKLGFNVATDSFTAFTLTKVSGSSSNLELEYDTDGSTITIIGKPNKNCKITTLTNVSGTDISVGDDISAGDNITVTGSYTKNGANKTFTLGVKHTPTAEETDWGHTSDETASISVTVKYNKYRIWCFQTSNDNFTITLDNDNKPNNLSTIFHEDAVSSVPTINKLTGGSGYVYILMPSNWTSKQFYFGSNFPETPLQQQTISIYSTNVNYTLYRSVNSLGNIRFELK